MAEQRTFLNNIAWKTDQQALQQTIAANKAVAGSFSSVADAAKALGLSAEQVKHLNAQLGVTGQQAQASSGAVRDLAGVRQQEVQIAQQVLQAEQRITEEQRTQGRLLAQYNRTRAGALQASIAGADPGIGAFPGEAGFGASGRTLGQRVTGIGRAIFNAPAVGPSTPIARGLIGAGAVVDKLGANVVQLGAAAGIAGVAVGAVAIALDRFNKELEQSQRRLSAALSAQQNYYEALQNLSSEQARAQLEQLQSMRPILEQQVTETRSALEGAFANAQNTFLGDVGARLLFTHLPTGQLSERLAELEAEMQVNIDTTTRFAQGLEQGVFASNDALQAEQALVKAREESARAAFAQIESEAQLRLDLARLRREGTSEEVQDRLRANEEEMTLIQNFIIPGIINVGEKTEQMVEQLEQHRQRLDDLRLANQLLVQSVEPVILQREAEARIAEALTDQSNATNDSLQLLAAAQEDVRDASAKTAEAYIELQLTQTEHSRNLVKLADEAAARQVDIREKANKRLEDIDAASSERILQLKENDNLTIENAVARGDIAAAQAVLRQQTLRIEQESRGRENQRQQAREQQEEQLALATEQADKLLAAAKERYDKELAQRQEAHATALEAESAANAALEAQQREHAFTMQYWNNIVADAQRAAGMSAEAAGRQMLQAAQNMQAAANVANSIRLTPVPNSRNMGPSSPGFAGYGTGTYGGSLIGSRAQSQSALRSFYDAYNAWAPAGRSVPTFDSGGISTSPGFYYAGVPEAHIPLSDMRGSGLMGGNTFVVNVDARGATMDEAHFRRIVRDEVLPRIETAKVETVLSLAEVNARQRHRL